MKNQRILFAFILLFSHSYGQDLTSKELNLKGKVKAIMEVSYEGKKTSKGYVKVKRDWEASWKQDCKMEFDTSGHLIKKTFYDKDLQVSRIEQFRYINGKIMYSEMQYHTRTFEYDNQGRLTVMKEIDRQPHQVKASNSNIIEKGKLTTYKFIYNDKNMLVRKDAYNAQGEKVGTTRFEYHDSGRLIREETTHKDSMAWYDYTYDANGNIIKKLWSDSDEGLLERTTAYYDNNIKTSEVWEHYNSGAFEGKVIYTFEKGNEKIITESDDSGQVEAKWTYHYKYDYKDNWVEKRVEVANDKIFIIERHIEYY